MKRFLRSALTLSALSALAFAPVFLPLEKASAQPTAQPTGTDASYLGGGISAGVTNGGNPGDNDDAEFGGNIQGRLAIPNTPVSARGAVLFGGESTAIVPTISYDIPVTNNANLYLGAGYSFITDEGQPSPLGNKDAAVISAGVEAEVNRKIVVYGDAKLGIDAYENSSAPAASLQAGAAYRFN